MVKRFQRVEEVVFDVSRHPSAPNLEPMSSYYSMNGKLNILWEKLYTGPNDHYDESYHPLANR